MDPHRSPLRLDIRLMDVKMARAFFNFSPLASRTPFLPAISEISPAVWKASLEISRLMRHTRHFSSGIVSEGET